MRNKRGSFRLDTFECRARYRRGRTTTGKFSLCLSAERN